MSVARRTNPERSCESVGAIRIKNRFWRAAMRREAASHENFFIAKKRDSESAQGALSLPGRIGTTSAACEAANASITKTPVAKAIPAISTNACIGFLRDVRITARMVCRAVDERASCVAASVRQHFLKPEAVFFDALVYSGWSAFRFPSARSD
jgi:hypothetical protein